nr:TetR family transcriptional regulator [Thermoanaerobacterium sp. RBIITD]
MANSQITKKVLANALKELMRSKSLNKISIQDIVDRCGLNRQTFYYHFHDIFTIYLVGFTKKKLLKKLFNTKAIKTGKKDFTRSLNILRIINLFA